MQGSLFDSFAQTEENLLPKDGEVFIYPGFFSSTESDAYLKYLLNDIHWQQDHMKFYGKTVALPRLTAWYGHHDNDYTYSGIKQSINSWTPELLEIKNRIETKSNIRFTSVLLNYYRNGNDHVSWHRDNEKVLKANPVIGSVSFGATRTFRFRHVDNKKLIRSIDLSHGTYLLMKGETQHKWEHQVPKTTKVKAPRINLTFRVLE